MVTSTKYYRAYRGFYFQMKPDNYEIFVNRNFAYEREQQSLDELKLALLFLNLKFAILLIFSSSEFIKVPVRLDVFFLVYHCLQFLDVS